MLARGFSVSCVCRVLTTKFQSGKVVRSLTLEEASDSPTCACIHHDPPVANKGAVDSVEEGSAPSDDAVGDECTDMLLIGTQRHVLIYDALTFEYLGQIESVHNGHRVTCITSTSTTASCGHVWIGSQTGHIVVCSLTRRVRAAGCGIACGAGT